MFMSMSVFFVVLASVLVLLLPAFLCLHLVRTLSSSRNSLSWLSSVCEKLIPLTPSPPARRRYRHPLLWPVVKRSKSPRRRSSRPVKVKILSKLPAAVSSICPAPVPSPSVALHACSDEIPASSPSSSSCSDMPDPSPLSCLSSPSLSPSSSPSIEQESPSSAAPCVFGPPIPYPGEPGALHFDKLDVSEFLRWWNIRADDFGLTGSQKCDRVLDYCAQGVQNIIPDLDGFESGNWFAPEKAIKSTFRRLDSAVTERISNLRRLIENTSSLPPDSFLDFRLYVFQFSSLTRSIPWTPLLRFELLLRGIPKALRTPTIEFRADNGWDVDGSSDRSSDLDFDKVKCFLLAQIDLRLNLAALELHHWIWFPFESSSLVPSSAPPSSLSPFILPASTSSSSVPSSCRVSVVPPSSHSSLSPSPSAFSSSVSSPVSVPSLLSSHASPSVSSVPLPSSPSLSPLSVPTLSLPSSSSSSPQSLASSLSSLNFALSSYLSSAPSSHISLPVPSLVSSSLASPVLRLRGGSGVHKLPNRCLWCDEVGHRKKECLDLVATFREGKVLFDHGRKVVDAITGLHLPVRVGSGGMKSGLSKPRPKSRHPSRPR
jgi:hypothetical protein